MKLKKILSAFALFMIVMACSTNPFTGKQTMAFVPNSQLFPTAFQQYNQMLSESNVETGTERSEMIKRTGQRLPVAAERWLNANGPQAYLKVYKWQYNLIDDKPLHESCLPGGNLVFYTGILPT